MTQWLFRCWFFSIAAGLLLTVCGSAFAANSGLVLTSADFRNGGQLPVSHTCDGAGVAPKVSWRNVPKGTQSLALIMHHKASASDIHTYWLLYNIAPSQSSAGPNVGSATLGANTVNDRNTYAPPCSQGPGDRQYILTLYALSHPVSFSGARKVTREMMLKAMSNITLASAELTFTYNRNQAQTTSTSDTVTDKTRCATIKHSVSDAGFSKVTVRCKGDYAYVASDTYPDHDVMNGITGTNEQVPVPSVGYAAPIKLTPKISRYLTSIDGAVGVAVNGVPIYDFSSQGDLDIYHYDAKADTKLLGQLDNCGGHAGRGDDYHYHAAPTCMMAAMKNKGDGAIIGWGYDGYPLYGNHNPDGSTIAANGLGVCNGQRDKTFGYRYHTSDKPPYIIRCLVGELDTSILPRVAPLRGNKTAMRSDLRPPREGVMNLTYTKGSNGSRTMRYDYHGQSYYVTYTPSASEKHCYDFEQKTISNGGKVEKGTFCRSNDLGRRH